MNSPASLMVTWPNQLWSGHVWLVTSWKDLEWLLARSPSFFLRVKYKSTCQMYWYIYIHTHIYIYTYTLRLQKKEPCLLKSTHGIRGRVLKKRCPTIWPYVSKNSKSGTSASNASLFSLFENCYENQGWPTMVPGLMKNSCRLHGLQQAVTQLLPNFWGFEGQCSMLNTKSTQK